MEQTSKMLTDREVTIGKYYSWSGPGNRTLIVYRSSKFLYTFWPHLKPIYKFILSPTDDWIPV